jgi:hypothetical protein
MKIILNIDGPHSGDHSREVARAVAEGMRALNHATIGSAPGLDYASDVDSIMNSLHSAVVDLLAGLAENPRAGADAWPAGQPRCCAGRMTCVIPGSPGG